ncbi:unnamed protein product [Urochloa decumbens]|uniref:Ripening-related protein 6 n=1 Tax=Urochloa decumbens TaxID=240449 RepID=A0ABC8XDB8_9POAL
MASTKVAAMAALVLLLQVTISAPMSSAVEQVPAVMTLNGFERGGPSECDGRYHDDSQMLAALSTGWYARGVRCFRHILIRSAQTDRTVVATVVDECDSRRGCKGNIVDTSPAVWAALGLDSNIGEVPVTWSDA